MVGIALISHGHFAEGVLEAAEMMFGDASRQVAALGLAKDENPDDFAQRLGEAIKQLNTATGSLSWRTCWAAHRATKRHRLPVTRFGLLPVCTW